MTTPKKSAFEGLRSQLNITPNNAQENSGSSTSKPIQTEAMRRASRKRLGKRRDPDYVPVSTFIQKDLHLKLRVQLVQERRDLADLLDQLLRAWLHEKGIRL
jgi:hypothetical protein